MFAVKRLSTVVSVNWVVTSVFVGWAGGDQSSKREKVFGRKNSNQ